MFEIISVCIKPYTTRKSIWLRLGISIPFQQDGNKLRGVEDWVTLPMDTLRVVNRQASKQ